MENTVAVAIWISSLVVKNFRISLIAQRSPAGVAWFVKASIFHSVNSAPSANGRLNPAWVWYIFGNIDFVFPLLQLPCINIY